MARGFLGGFNVGFNAVDAVLRDKREMEDRERRNKREDERWKLEKERIDRERSLERELSEAGQTPTQGKAVGGNFATSEADQRFLAEQDAAIAELEGRDASPVRLAAGAGSRIVDRDDPRAKDTRAGYLARVSDVQRRHGKVSESITTDELSRQIQRSGVKDALDLLLAGGTPEQAQSLLKESGRIDGQLVAKPTVRKGPNDVEMPDFDLSVVKPDGSVQHLGSALTMRFMADNPAEYLKLLNQEGKDRVQSERDAAKLALDERRVAVSEQQARTMEQYRRDQIAESRARRQAEAQAAQSGSMFQPLSTTEEKALRDAITALPENADPNKAVDVAARLLSANRANMSFAEAALIASNPDVSIHRSMTTAGPVDFLVVPGGTDAQGRPTPARRYLMAPGAPFEELPVPAPEPKSPSAMQRFVNRFLDWSRASEKDDEKGGAKAPSAAELGSELSPQTEALGARVDTARAARIAARDRLNTYGSRQQKQDPEGYAAAKRAVEEADAAFRAAQAEFEAAVNRELPPVRR